MEASPLAGRANPNALGVGSRLAPAGAVEAVAYLGAWKDCNRDGYVGMAESALWRYRAELLPDATVCPDGTAHHQDGWVWEFLSVYPRPVLPSSPPQYADRAIVDPEAFVWGDLGRPGDAAREVCAVYPLPRGATAGTGGLLGWADCQADHAVADQVSRQDPDGGLGLGFEDPRRPERSCRSALNQPLGVYDNPHRCPGERRGVLEEGSGEPAFTAWDCGSERSVAAPRDPTAPEDGGRGQLSGIVVSDPRDGRAVARHNFTDADGRYHRVPPPDARPGPPTGSAYDAANGTFLGATSCDGSVAGLRYVSPTLLQAGDPDFFVEHRYAGRSDVKRQTDFPMAFNEVAKTRPVPDGGTFLGLGEALHGALGDYSRYGGVLALEQAAGEEWRSVGVLRGLAAPALRRDLSPSGPLHVTFYAKLGAASRAGAPGAPGVYGAEACASDALAAAKAWDCAASRWWSPEHGASAPPAGVKVARPGEAYHLRDVDCHDGSVARGAPAQASLVAFSGEAPCGDLPAVG